MPRPMSVRVSQRRLGLATSLAFVLGLTSSGMSQAAPPATSEAGQSASQYANQTRDARNGYTAADAYRFNAKWSMDGFLMGSPDGVYSYFNLPEFMPHAVIRRGGPVLALERRPNTAVGATSIEDAAGNAHTFDKVVNGEGSPLHGVIVLHRGDVVYEAYPGMRPTDNHVWMSNAKPLASLLIAQLEEEGRMDVQKPVAHYLPEARGTAWEKVRVIDVLNQASGLDLEENAESQQRPDAAIRRLFAAEVGLPDSTGVEETHNEVVLSIPKLREPGTANEYSSVNTQMLGLIIEAVTDARLADLISEKIWIPAGMEGDAVLGLTPQGNGVIHGLISSRLIDMARFGLLYTPSWNKTASERVVSDAMIEKIRTAGNSKSFLKGEQGPAIAGAYGETPVANAYQWDAVFADGDFYKSGHNGQGIYVSPGSDVVVVWVANGYPQPVLVEPFARKIAKWLR